MAVLTWARMLDHTGNSQSIFPCFPGDAVGTNSSLTDAGAATVADAGATGSWSQGNSFTKIFSATARVVGPGLLDAAEVYFTSRTCRGTPRRSAS